MKCLWWWLSICQSMIISEYQEIMHLLFNVLPWVLCWVWSILGFLGGCIAWCFSEVCFLYCFPLLGYLVLYWYKGLWLALLKPVKPNTVDIPRRSAPFQRIWRSECEGKVVWGEGLEGMSGVEIVVHIYVYMRKCNIWEKINRFKST